MSNNYHIQHRPLTKVVSDHPQTSQIPQVQPMEHLPDVPREREVQIFGDNDIDIDGIRESFQNSIDNFTEIVNARISSDPVNYAKAVHAFNTQCERIINGSDAMLQKSLHTFGKESYSSVRETKKNSGRIPVQSKSRARRKFKIRGAGQASKGRPSVDLPRTSENHDGVVWHSLAKQKKKKKKRAHNLAKIVKLNVPSDKKH